MYKVDLGYNEELFDTRYTYDRISASTIDVIIWYQKVKHVDLAKYDWELEDRHILVSSRLYIKMYSHNEDMIIWCKENCKNRWGFRVSNKFYFCRRDDMIEFKLRWL